MTPRADLLTRIDAWGLRAPARIAHRSGEQVLTWGELITRSDALAAHLVSLGLPSEQPVVLNLSGCSFSEEAQENIKLLPVIQ